MAATDARPVPQKNVAYRHYFAIRKNDGDLATTWAGQDTEVSKDGAAFADATSEATEIGTTGCGYVDLTAAEMNADAVVVKVTVTTTDAIPYVVTLFPEEGGDIRVNITHALGSTFDPVLDTDIPTVEDIRTEIDSNSTQLSAIVADTNELQTDWANGGRLDVILDSVLTTGGTGPWTTGAGGGDGSSLTAIPWNAAWDAEVQSEVTDALNAYDPPTKAELDSGFAALNDFDPASDTVVNVTNVAALAAGERDAIATAALKLDFTGITGEASRSMINALRQLRNKWSVASNTLTVTKEDDSTTAWTAALTVDANADPITASDPS